MTGPGRHDVTIGEDQAALGVDDEAGRLARHVPFGVERARQVDLDRDDAGRDALERARPARIFGVGDRHAALAPRSAVGCACAATVSEASSSSPATARVLCMSEPQLRIERAANRAADE